MPKRNWKFFACLLSLLLASCSAPAEIGSATAAGKKFHDRFNQQDYAAIYADADPKFRAAVKPDDLNKLLSRVHDKLGNVTDSTRTGFHINYNTGGSTITFSYSSKFQSGEAQEDFIWLRSGNDLHLLRYNVKSSALDDSNVQ